VHRTTDEKVGIDHRLLSRSRASVNA